MPSGRKQLMSLLTVVAATGVVYWGEGLIQRRTGEEPPSAMREVVPLQQAALAAPKPGEENKPAAPPSKRPVLVIDQETQSAGEVPKGEKAKFRFQVKNTGDAPLEITAKPGCGCTVANYDRTIAPGKMGFIEASMDTSHFKGEVTKYITVTSNDPQRPTVQLRIKAKIKAYVDVEPERYYARLYHGDGLTHDFTVISNERSPLKITSLEPNQTWLKATAEPVAGDPHRYVVHVQVLPSIPLGGFAGAVRIRTNSSHAPELSVTVHGTVTGEIRVEPSGVWFGSWPAGRDKGQRRQLTVKKRNGMFEITKVDTGDPHLRASVKPVTPGKEYTVFLVTTGGWSKGAHSGKIVIATNDKEQPELSVSWSAQVR